MKCYRSVIPYCGGKYRMIKTLLPILEASKATRLIEPFGGSGVVGLNWVLNTNKDYVYNDKNPNIANIMKMVFDKYNFEDIPSHNPIWNREFFNEWVKKPEEWDHIITYYMLHSCYGAKLSTPWYSETRMNRFNRERRIKHWQGLNDLIKEFKSNILTYAMDYKDLIALQKKHYTMGYSNPNNDIWYFDPPYYDLSYYQEGKGFNHKELAKELDDLKAKWVLSYNDTKEVRELYNGYYIYEVEHYYSLDRPQHIKELIISNWEIEGLKNNGKEDNNNINK